MALSLIHSKKNNSTVKILKESFFFQKSVLNTNICLRYLSPPLSRPASVHRLRAHLTYISETQKLLRVELIHRLRS